MVEDLKLLLDQRGLTEVHLVGHSFGGRIAMAFAAAYPHLAKSVVIEDMEMMARQSGGEAPVEQWGRQILALNTTYPSIDALMQAVRSVYGDDPQMLTEILSHSPIHHGPGSSITLLSTPYHTYLWGSYANAMDLGPALKAYQGPVLFLQADPQASAISAAGFQQIRSLKPNASIIPMPGSSHAIHQSLPEKFTQIISQFLKSGGKP